MFALRFCFKCDIDRCLDRENLLALIKQMSNEWWVCVFLFCANFNESFVFFLLIVLGISKIMNSFLLKKSMGNRMYLLFNYLDSQNNFSIFVSEYFERKLTGGNSVERLSWNLMEFSILCGLWDEVTKVIKVIFS